MKRHIKYLKYVVRHKWFVLQAGRQLGVSFWQLLIHDWSKFLPDEWLPYARYFRNPDGSPRLKRQATGGFDKASDIGELKDAFDRAWNRHQKRHPHHWQYWLLTMDMGTTEALPMPDKYRREMLADWMGAGKALGKPDTFDWYMKNKDKMVLHPETRGWVEVMLHPGNQ